MTLKLFLLGARLLICLGLAQEARAQIGGSVKDLTRLYGKPSLGPYQGLSGMAPYRGDPPAQVGYDFSAGRLHVRALFGGRDVSTRRCVHLSIWNPGGPLTDKEVEAQLAAHADGSTWMKVEGGWKRADNKALAYMSTYSGFEVFTADFYRSDPPEHLKTVYKSLPVGIRPKRSSMP